MRVGTEAHSMTTSPWYDPLGILISNKYYMYASGGMYALSSEGARIITGVPLSQRRLSGGGDDTSLGLWVLGYNISYLDDRRLGVFPENGSCPDNFIGKALSTKAHTCCSPSPEIGLPACKLICVHVIQQAYFRM